MKLENMYFDLWDGPRSWTMYTQRGHLGMMMGLANTTPAGACAVAMRNGLTVPELEELVYQASTYLGYVSGKSIRRIGGLKDAGITW